MKKCILFIYKSTGSLDLLIGLTLTNKLPFQIESIEIVSDSIDYYAKIKNSTNELDLIREKYNVDIYFSKFFIRDEKLLNFSIHVYRLIQNYFFNSQIILKLIRKFFSILNFKNLNRNITRFKKSLTDESLIFIERKNWDIRHIAVSNNFHDKNIYIIPDAPMRQKDGYTNHRNFINKKNKILLIPKGHPEKGNNTKLIYEPIAGNQEFIKKMKYLMSEYKKKYGYKKSILILLQKYSDISKKAEFINWKGRKMLSKYLSKKYFNQVFSNIKKSEKIQIILSSHPGLSLKAYQENERGNSKTKDLINSNKKFYLKINEKLSLANGISSKNVYSEFTSSLFYFPNSNIIIKKGNTFEYYTKDNLIKEDYENFLLSNKLSFLTSN